MTEELKCYDISSDIVWEPCNKSEAEMEVFIYNDPKNKLYFRKPSPPDSFPTSLLAWFKENSSSFNPQQIAAFRILWKELKK